MIAEFAQTQVERTRFIRVLNSVGDGNKIREFRERLAQAMNRFEVGLCYALSVLGSNNNFRFLPISIPMRFSD
jgi:hypothetical protein